MFGSLKEIIQFFLEVQIDFDKFLKRFNKEILILIQIILISHFKFQMKLQIGMTNQFKKKKTFH